jgi:hypothetical protein
VNVAKTKSRWRWFGKCDVECEWEYVCSGRSQSKWALSWGACSHTHVGCTQSSESVKSEGRDSRDLTSEVNCNCRSTNFFLVVEVKVGSGLCLDVVEGCLLTCENGGKLARMCCYCCLVSLFCKRSGGGDVSGW